MRKYLVTLLILLMTAFPVWSAGTVCCHLQAAPPTQPLPTHHCCDHMKLDKQHCQHSTNIERTSQADNCQCDLFQHSQFVLSLPELPVLQPVPHFAPETSIPAPLAERHETIIRPPIA